MEVSRRLFASRKFWLLILDTVVSLATFFFGKYASPATAQDLLFLVAALQPVFVSIIVGIAVEDAAEKGAAETWKDITPTAPELK